MGVTLFPLDGADPDMLLRHADQAMYQAKQAGRNRYALFDAEHDRFRKCAAIRRKASSVRSRTTSCDLHYQPKVNMRSGDVVGMEALIRWQHPQRGLLDPADFLPMVDFVGLHGQVGDWVLETALAQAEAWAAGRQALAIGINVAAEQLQSTAFADPGRGAGPPSAGAAGSLVEFEILETAALNDLEKVAAVMTDCQALGVSFRHRRFRHRLFVADLPQAVAGGHAEDRPVLHHDMLTDPDDLSIVDSIIGLAAAFRRNVIAEGVETVAHGTLLLRLGCDLAQGYGIARPMPASRVLAMRGSRLAPARGMAPGGALAARRPAAADGRNRPPALDRPAAPRGGRRVPANNRRCRRSIRMTAASATGWIRRPRALRALSVLRPAGRGPSRGA
jgi:EAL domain-containing protein (putative c-di-GMP-specific phosphodiesterase class I)